MTVLTYRTQPCSETMLDFCNCVVFNNNITKRRYNCTDKTLERNILPEPTCKNGWPTKKPSKHRITNENVDDSGSKCIV